MDPATLVNRYEQLRRQALGELFTEGAGLGLALFIRRGMTAWMEAWTKHASGIGVLGIRKPVLETLPWISVLTAEKLYTVDSIILVMENSTLSFGVPVVATPNRLRNQIQWTGCFILFRNNYKYNI